jgi:arylsulfatase B
MQPLVIFMFTTVNLRSSSSGSSSDAANNNVSRSSKQQPHLVFALIDDWGWYMSGFHGNQFIQTPFIDHLVREEGAQIERHYAYIMCSPSRRSFLSGRVPPHSGVQNHGPTAILDLRMHTIADSLRSAGYTTGYSEKWHAGHEVMALTPTHRGFDRSLGYFNAMCDHYTQEDSFDGCRPTPGACTLKLHRNLLCAIYLKVVGSLTHGVRDGVVDLWDSDRPGFGLDGVYGDYLYVGRAVETIMGHNTSVPLFYYLATQVAHDPMQVPNKYIDMVPQQENLTGNMLTGYAFSSVVDESIKNVTAALKAKGMWEDTLLIVSADNVRIHRFSRQMWALALLCGGWCLSATVRVSIRG